jgi:sugar O-acyltransferase (sialic acid O-acetyltransferase NeuD family)
MPGVVIFATGSPIVVDIEESLRRAGIALVAGVVNRPGTSFLSEPRLLITVERIPGEFQQLSFIVPLFAPCNRQQAVREAQALGFQHPFSLIDPTVAAPQGLKIEAGLYVNAGCSLGAASVFGSFVFINRGAAIGHHVNLARYVSIGPGAVICGEVSVGKGTMIGAGAVVLPQVKIGENSVVGAGAVVTRNVGDHMLVVGNPAHVAKSGIAGYKDECVT